MKLTISPIPQYDTQVGHLVSIMNLTRNATLNIVKDLDIQQLDFEIDPASNSIGSLLMHIGALEFFTQLHIFKYLPYERHDMVQWHKAVSGELPKKLIRGNSLEYYIEALEKVRNITLKNLSLLKDDWLYQEIILPDNVIMNNYFKIYHTSEDELCHQGQIKWLKKRLPGHRGQV